MATILHPVTQISGAPSYTAQQIRRTVNPFIAAPNGTPFDGIQGVRSGCGTLLSISGNTVTVKRHAGQISPYSGYGVYHYSMDADMQVQLSSLTASYKIAMVMSDKSLGQGTGNTIAPTVLDFSTSDSSVQGIVLGTVVNGVCSETALRITPMQLISAFKKSMLPTSNVVEGQEAYVSSDGANNGYYVYSMSNWVPRTPVRIFNGSRVITGTGTSEYTFFSQADYVSIVGRKPAYGDVIVFTNGDRSAGTFPSAMSVIDPNNMGVNVVFPVNVVGQRRINYVIMAGA